MTPSISYQGINLFKFQNDVYLDLVGISELYSITKSELEILINKFGSKQNNLGYKIVNIYISNYEKTLIPSRLVFLIGLEIDKNKAQRFYDFITEFYNSQVSELSIKCNKYKLSANIAWRCWDNDDSADIY